MDCAPGTAGVTRSKEWGRLGSAISALLLAAPFAAVSCGGPTPSISLHGTSPVAGNVLMVSVQGTSFDIKGGYALFIDRDPVAAGAAVPRAVNVMEARSAVVPVAGLAIGRHVLNGVPEDGAHHRLAGSMATTLGFTVNGPAATVQAPLAARSGQSITLRLSSYGLTIADIASDSSGHTAHYDVIIDGDLPAAGAKITAPVSVRTTDALVALAPLGAGDHVIWIVLANGSNNALSPLVAARAEVTVI